MSSLAPISCPFCEIVHGIHGERIIDENEQALLIRDGFPVSNGHSLVVPKRHIATFFETTGEERDAFYALIDRAKLLIDQEYKPDSYNIGINDGPAAGQTVPHLHIHLIPRYENSEFDPRGGVRWVIPGKADYWSDQ